VSALFRRQARPRRYRCESSLERARAISTGDAGLKEEVAPSVVRCASADPTRHDEAAARAWLVRLHASRTLSAAGCSWWGSMTRLRGSDAFAGSISMWLAAWAGIHSDDATLVDRDARNTGIGDGGSNLIDVSPAQIEECVVASSAPYW